MDAGEETRLTAVDVADAGEVPLIQQGDADGNIRSCTQPPFRLRRVPDGAQEVLTSKRGRRDVS
jgi:hypothetical protein